MKTWTAWVTKSERYQVTVQAETWSDARSAAEAVDPEEIDGEITFRADNIVQIGEPWVYSRGWYDLHGPGDVIVVERAPGNVFTADDINELAKRIRGIGWLILACWNGVGTGTVSFKCSGRKQEKQFTGEQLAILTAPRVTEGI